MHFDRLICSDPRVCCPNVHQVIFINQTNDRKLDDFFERNHTLCKFKFWEYDYDFVFLPKVFTPEFCREVVRYNFPEFSDSEIDEQLKKHYLLYDFQNAATSLSLRFVTEKELQQSEERVGIILNKDLSIKNIVQDVDYKAPSHNGFIVSLASPDHNPNNYRNLCNYTSHSKQYYLFGELSYTNDEDMFRQFDEFFSKTKPEKYAELHSGALHSYIDIDSTRVISHSRRGTLDDYFPDEAFQLAKEIKERIDKLRGMGINEVLISNLLHSHNGVLSDLVITSDNRIFLPDFNNKEIIMHPLPKAVFFLFLKHPEGIILKHLSDYKEELTSLYKKILGENYIADMESSIDHLTYSCDNSINEKCSRIREAFLKEMDESVARFYFVTGERATPKKIILDRKKVHWEE